MPNNRNYFNLNIENLISRSLCKILSVHYMYIYFENSLVKNCSDLIMFVCIMYPLFHEPGCDILSIATKKETKNI